MQQDAEFLTPTSKVFSVHQRLETSGARCAHVFTVGETLNLAVAQLATDVPGRPANMNNGNPDVEAILYRWEGGRFAERRRFACPGGEDALCFRSGGASYLAFASICTAGEPYDFNANSPIYREEKGEWVLDEEVPSFGAKQWYHFFIDGREFLALAQGLLFPQASPKGHGRSAVLERKDGRWQEFQVLGGRMGYNWHHFKIDDHHFLAYADQASPSLIYRWDGAKFVPYQTFSETGGRAFLHFTKDGEHWLAFTDIVNASTLCRWNGELFVAHQQLGAGGAREFQIIEKANALFLVRVRFIEGTPASPKTDLSSQLFQWRDGQLELVEEFPTFGGTDASYFHVDGEDYLAVSNSLTPAVRFRQDMVIYKLALDNA